MSDSPYEHKLTDGTLIRHKVAGYEGRIDGTTAIKSCFTAGGTLLDRPSTKHLFQYRVLVRGESMRRIAPAEDLEVIEGAERVVCPACRASFQSKPGLAGKPGGLCECGGRICPACLACQGASEETAGDGKSACLKQRKRQIKKAAGRKRG